MRNSNTFLSIDTEFDYKELNVRILRHHVISDVGYILQLKLRNVFDIVHNACNTGVKEDETLSFFIVNTQFGITNSYMVMFTRL